MTVMWVVVQTLKLAPSMHHCGTTRCGCIRTQLGLAGELQVVVVREVRWQVAACCHLLCVSHVSVRHVSTFLQYSPIIVYIYYAAFKTIWTAPKCPMLCLDAGGVKPISLLPRVAKIQPVSLNIQDGLKTLVFVCFRCPH